MAETAQTLKFHETFPSCVGIEDQRELTANFGVVVVKELSSESPPHPYLAVDESKNRGWWLPAGFIDPGEDVETGAKRECLEEGGIECTMTGVIRIEVGSGRCRFVYAADPIDTSQTPKAIADKESNGAAWFTVEQMTSMQLEQDILFRGPELFEYGRHIDQKRPYPGTDFLVTTYEETKKPTWTRTYNTCPTDRHCKIIVVYENEIYLTNRGMTIPSFHIKPIVKNSKLTRWCQNHLNFKIDAKENRIIRVYHAMREDGGSMGFVFKVVAVEKPGKEFTKIDVDDLEDVVDADRILLQYALSGPKCWNLRVLDEEYKSMRDPGPPSHLISRRLQPSPQQV